MQRVPGAGEREKGRRWEVWVERPGQVAREQERSREAGARGLRGDQKECGMGGRRDPSDSEEAP